MVSIIILVRDNLGFIKRCVDSVLKYTKTPYEFIFIMQGVTKDEVFQYINDVPANKIIAVNEKNTGVTPGRNQGISLSVGDHLLFFDDDAYVSEDLSQIPTGMHEMDWLERLLQYYKIPGVGIVGQSGTYINPDTPGVFWECKSRGAECDVQQGYCFMFSREVVDKIGVLDPFFGKFWHEESEYALRAKANGFKVVNAMYIGVTHFGSGSGDDGTYGSKIKYMFDKWGKDFNRILVPRSEWK